MKAHLIFMRNPFGQVLAATLLFCFIFLVLFVGLYKSGVAFQLKEKSKRGTDLTALSSGAVYANGLGMVRSTNVILMIIFAKDIGTIGLRISPLLAGLPENLPLVVETALAADPHNRDQWQEFQGYLFGIDPKNPARYRLGLYPFLVELQAHGTASDNGLRNDLVFPAVLYNFETNHQIPQMSWPSMALRFRRAGEMIPEPAQDIYSLEHDGNRYYFSSSQVESAQNPRSTGQMRVKRSLPSPFAGMWVRKEKEETPGDLNKLVSKIPFGATVFRELKIFLDKVVLDVTHKDNPPDHSLILVTLLAGKVGKKSIDLTQLSEVTVEGGGLAAWNIADPPFQPFLRKIDPIGLPLGGLSNLPNALPPEPPSPTSDPKQWVGSF